MQLTRFVFKSDSILPRKSRQVIYSECWSITGRRKQRKLQVVADEHY